MAGHTQAHGQVLGGASLYDILDIQVALPVSGVLAIGTVPGAIARAVGVDFGQVQFAARVRQGRCQARQAQAAEVVSILQLP
ncbi:hypothetical protein D3C80_2059020 [compost metagenome]